MRHVVAIFVCAALTTTAHNAAPYTVTIDPSTNFGTFEGFGVSLCWWTKVFQGDETASDLLWTKKNVTLSGGSTVPGLNFNIARYNVGGTTNSTVNGQHAQLSSEFSWWKQLEGYWVDGANPREPTSPSWNWNADPEQRAALVAGLQRGVTDVEFFSNSPMWYFLNNLNPSGSNDGSSDNLNHAHIQDHAIYMTTVASQLIQMYNIPSASIECFNEPVATWWKSTGTQEGCHFDYSTQATTLLALQQEIMMNHLGEKNVMRVSASDESLTDMALQGWLSFNESVRSVISQFNVHGYQGTAGNRSGLYQETVVLGGKTLRMSEHGDGDDSGQTLAQNMLLDFHYLHPTSYVYWQAFDAAEGWTLVTNQMPDSLELIAATPKYYVLAQYSRHILKGMLMLNVQDPNDTTVASFDGNSSTLVLVTTNVNTNQDLSIVYDASAFSSISSSNGNFRWVSTMSSSGNKYNQDNAVTVDVTKKIIVSIVPANSVVTIEITGVVV